MSNTLRHAHRLRRHVYKKTGTAVFMCTLDRCYFKAECTQLLGKEVVCNLCGERFIMNEYQIKRTKPHCENCKKIMVKGADGHKYYVRRDSRPHIASLTTESGETLHSRLHNIISPDNDESEDL